MAESTVIIVGSGPSGLATAACLTHLSIPYIILEREDCYAPIWNKYSYERLHLHLPKEYCELPMLKFPTNTPKYVPKQDFLNYLENYVHHFGINPLYSKEVVGAVYEQGSKRWRVSVRKKYNMGGGGDNVEELLESYVGRFLVVATGETSDPYWPEIQGLGGFKGKVVHSTGYKSGKEYEGKCVLVVGAGNSGMEIALDLANHGATTSIVVRNPVHVLSRRMVSMGLFLLKYLPLYMVDTLMVMLSKLSFGDITKYGLSRPHQTPFLLKLAHGKYPLIDVGTFHKIKTGQIQVLPAIASVKGNEVLLVNDKSYVFDAIILATGFRRSTNEWLKGDEYLLNEDGLPKPSFPNHWKGKNGLYCAGLARRGLYGAAMDAQCIANDIRSLL